MKQIEVSTYGIFPEDCRENTWKLRQMLDQLREEEGIQIIFEPGTYHFYPDYAVEKLLYISNHDEDTIKRIAFDLTGFQHLVIRGEETQFLFHTDVIPFYLHACEDITIEGVKIDYVRPGYSEGKIRELEPQRMVVEIDPTEYPYEIFNGRLYFRGENFFNEMTYGCLEMDGKRHAPVCQGHDIGFNRPYPWSYGAVFDELEPGVVEIRLLGDKEFLKTSQVGNDLIFRHHARTHPAFYVTYSKDIVLQDIVLYHCVGMAVIAQFSENLTMRRFDVRRHPEKKRIFTATADGFHLIYCRGKIQIQDCLLENQLDDPLNVHGIYGRIHKIISEREVMVELVEGMQKGVPLGKKGEQFRIIDNETMLEIETVRLEEHQMLNGDYQYMKFDRPVTEWKESFVVENTDYVPDVLVEGCTFQNNRARGLLLDTGSVNVLCRINGRQRFLWQQNTAGKFFRRHRIFIFMPDGWT